MPRAEIAEPRRLGRDRLVLSQSRHSFTTARKPPLAYQLCSESLDSGPHTLDPEASGGTDATENEGGTPTLKVEGDSVWEGNCESRTCSRDTCPESYITNTTRVRRTSQESVPLCGTPCVEAPTQRRPRTGASPHPGGPILAACTARIQAGLS
jgi:hypothetical protein